MKDTSPKTSNLASTTTLPSACPSCGSPSLRAALRFKTDRTVYFCRSCSLGFLWPKKKPEELVQYFQTTYYKDIPGFDTKRLHVFEKDFIRITRGLTPGKLFDFGCGFGHFMLLAGRKGWIASGSDVAPQAVKHATEELHLNARVGGVDDLGSMGTGYRLVTAWNVLDHLSDPVAAMRGLHGLLEPGGRIGIRSNNFTFRKKVYLVARTFNITFLLTNFGFFFDTIFTPGSYRRLLKQCGFTNVIVRNSSIAGDVKGGGPGTMVIRILQVLIEAMYHLSLGRVCLGPSILITAEKPAP